MEVSVNEESKILSDAASVASICISRNDIPFNI